MRRIRQLSRRHFLQSSAACASLAVPGSSPAAEPKVDASPENFFTLERRNGRWWLIDPSEQPTFSLGLNHIDPASLRYEENEHLWRQRYGNDMQCWLTKSVRKNLLDWGFNGVGWTQEVVTQSPKNHRHSRSFTFEEYQWLNMPYCHMLPFSEIHQWEVETRLPDFRSQGFADWCDHVAREHCSRFRDDPKLIGYWYSDCPTWVHVRNDNRWRGPLFDPAKLETPEGRAELFDRGCPVHC